MLSFEVDNELTGKIINCFFIVYNNLGFGYLEKVYQNALYVELGLLGLKVEVQKPIKVIYKEHIVGEYFADMFVENTVLVEIKTVVKLNKEHEAQLINYLISTQTQIGLLLNFGPKPEVSRKINTIEKYKG